MNKKTNKLRWFKFPDTIGPKAVIEDNLEEEGFSYYEVNPSPNDEYIGLNPKDVWLSKLNKSNSWKRYEVIVKVSEVEIDHIKSFKYEWGFELEDLKFYEIDAKTKLYIEAQDDL